MEKDIKILLKSSEPCLDHKKRKPQLSHLNPVPENIIDLASNGKLLQNLVETWEL